MSEKRWMTKTAARIAVAAVVVILALNVISPASDQNQPERHDDANPLPAASNERHDVISPEAAEAAEDPEDGPQASSGHLSESEAEKPQEMPPEEAVEIDLPEGLDISEVREPAVTDLSGMDDLSDMLDAVASKYNCAAVSLAVFDGEYDYSAYQYGWADISTQRLVDTDTKFRVASLSKLTSAIIAMGLADAGFLDIDEDISVYLDYEVKNPDFPEMAITSRMLMQHTSSIYDSDMYLNEHFSYKADSTRQLLISDSTYRARQPGALFEYSDFGLIALKASR